MAGRLIRVLVVDDSPLVRRLIREALTGHARMEVIGEAQDGLEALKQIAVLRPDVVTLDIEMPRLDGLGVLRRAAGRLPLSFVMVSTLTQTGAQITFEALNLGAFDYVTKPQDATKAARPAFQRQLQLKVIAAAMARGKPRQLCASSSTPAAPTWTPGTAGGSVVAIGISCGGPPTLYKLLPAFPKNFAPILITQHMPPAFTGPFAQHLDRVCQMNVREAQEGDFVAPGTILIAPGDRHLKLVSRGQQLVVRLDGGPPVSGHRPSADAMFSSLAQVCPTRTVAVVMTGMGRDGASGLAQLAQAGATTLAQDEASSYVYGMPKAAAATGHVHEITSLDQMAAAIARCLQGGRRRAVAFSRTSGDELRG